MGKFSFLFEFGYIIFMGGGGISPLPLDIFTSNIPYIQFFVLLYCRMLLHTYNVLI